MINPPFPPEEPKPSIKDLNIAGCPSEPKGILKTPVIQVAKEASGGSGSLTNSITSVGKDGKASTSLVPPPMTLPPSTRHQRFASTNTKPVIKIQEVGPHLNVLKCTSKVLAKKSLNQS